MAESTPRKSRTSENPLHKAELRLTTSGLFAKLRDFSRVDLLSEPVGISETPKWEKRPLAGRPSQAASDYEAESFRRTTRHLES